VTTVSIGRGISPVADTQTELPDEPTEAPTTPAEPEPTEAPTPQPEPQPVEAPAPQRNILDLLKDPDDVNVLRSMIHDEFAAAVADVERRLGQARELERSALLGERRQVHAEDLNLTKFMIDGYTLTANSPVAGSIAWSSLHVVFMGVDYTIADANTALKYAWFVKPGSGTTATLQTSNTMPTLGANDALIFINNGGTPISVLESSVAYAVGPGAIGNAQLDTATQTLLTNLQQADIAMQSQLDGAINSYYQANPPWPDGAPSPAGGNVNQGDIWYDSDNGWTYRWTGTTGSPVNTWFRIADTDMALIAGKVNLKVTTYLSASTVAPVAPSGGFTTGDMWMQTDLGNKLMRWSGSAWVAVLLGDSAISDVGGAKVGSGINGTNITTGTVVAARVGAGVNGAVLSTATGTVGNTQIAANAVTPAKINAAFHLLY